MIGPLSEFLRVRTVHFLMFFRTKESSCFGVFAFMNLLAITSDMSPLCLRFEKSGIMLSLLGFLARDEDLLTPDDMLGTGEGDLTQSDNGSSNKSGVSMAIRDRGGAMSSSSSDTASVRVWSRSEEGVGDMGYGEEKSGSGDREPPIGEIESAVVGESGGDEAN